MKLKEFLDKWIMYCIEKQYFSNKELHRFTDSPKEIYNKILYSCIAPKIFCNDGFNLSVQVHRGAYCRSENGYQTFGRNWETAEWGYPSEHIDSKIYNPENEYTIDSVGSLSIELLQKLFDEHRGIDWEKTLDDKYDLFVTMNNKIIKEIVGIINLNDLDPVWSKLQIGLTKQFLFKEFTDIPYLIKNKDFNHIELFHQWRNIWIMSNVDPKDYALILKTINKHE